jgi:hypothetical protein
VKVINGAEPLPFEINKKKLQVGLDQLLNETVSPITWTTLSTSTLYPANSFSNTH